MKRALWFVLIAVVLLTLAGATWVVSALRAPMTRISRIPTLSPQPA
jgi:hypothetical protein